jgi:hypothetical protein
MNIINKLLYRNKRDKHLQLIDSGKIPSSYKNGPELSYYTESPTYYYKLIDDCVKYFKDKPKGATKEDKNKALIAYRRMVHATWGLIARGAESLPYALQLSKSSNRDKNQAANSVWGWLRKEVRVYTIIETLRLQLANEKELQKVVEIIECLGYLRNQKAIEIISPYLLNSSEDKEIQLKSAIAIGMIAHKRFDKTEKSDETIQLAINWLEKKK